MSYCPCPSVDGKNIEKMNRAISLFLIGQHIKARELAEDANSYWHSCLKVHKATSVEGRRSAIAARCVAVALESVFPKPNKLPGAEMPDTATNSQISFLSEEQKAAASIDNAFCNYCLVDKYAALPSNAMLKKYAEFRCSQIIKRSRRVRR